MIVRELFAKLGLQVEEAGFLKAALLIGGVSSGLGLIGKAVEALEPVLHAVGDTARKAFELSHAAERIGVTTDAFQELSYAARAAGLDAASMEVGLGILSRNLLQASQGSQEAAQHFQSLGIAVKGADGQVRPADAVLGDIAAKFATMPDGTRKTALAMELFGRSGRELIPFLNRGPAGLADLKEEAHRLGVVMSSDLIGRSKEYMAVQLRFGAAMEGLKLALVGPFVGPNGAIAALTDWIVANRETLGRVLPKLFNTVKRVAKDVGYALLAIGRAFLFIVEHKAILFGMLGALVFLFRRELYEAILKATLQMLVFGTESVLAGAKAALAGVAAAAPWIALTLAIAAAILILEDLYVFVEGGESLIGEFAGRILKMYDDFLTPKEGDWWIVKKIKEAFYWLTHLVDTYDAFVGTGQQADAQVEALNRAGLGDISVNDPRMKDPKFMQAVMSGTYVDPVQAAIRSANSPTVPVPAGGNMSSTFNANITVNAATGDPDAIAARLREELDRYNDDRLREAAAAVAGG